MSDIHNSSNRKHSSYKPSHLRVSYPTIGKRVLFWYRKRYLFWFNSHFTATTLLLSATMYLVSSWGYTEVKLPIPFLCFLLTMRFLSFRSQSPATRPPLPQWTHLLEPEAKINTSIRYLNHGVHHATEKTLTRQIASCCKLLSQKYSPSLSECRMWI